LKRKGLSKVVLGMALILLLAFTLSGCGSEENKNGASTSEGNNEQAVEIRFSTWHPPESEETKNVWTPMLEEMKKNSNNRITYKLFDGAALGDPKGHFDIVQDGLSDMGYYTATWTPDRFPISDVLSMPVEILGKDIAVDIGNEMYNRILHQDFPDDVKVTSLNGCISAYFWTTEPIESIDDLKGLRIRSPGGLQTSMIIAVGAEPVFMPLGDVYMAMETGDIDGIVTCPQLYEAYKLYELGKHALVGSFGCVTEGVVMHKHSWETIPEDLKPIVEEAANNPYKLTGGLTEDVINNVNSNLEKEGVIFHQLPEEQMNQLYSKFENDVVKKWVDDMEAKGLPGKEALLNYKAVLNKYNIEFPAFPSEWEKEVK